jgi:hypothetical protein
LSVGLPVGLSAQTTHRSISPIIVGCCLCPNRLFGRQSGLYLSVPPFFQCACSETLLALTLQLRFLEPVGSAQRVQEDGGDGANGVGGAGHGLLCLRWGRSQFFRFMCGLLTLIVQPHADTMCFFHSWLSLGGGVFKSLVGVRRNISCDSRRCHEQTSCMPQAMLLVAAMKALSF